MKKYLILMVAIFAINSASAQFSSARVNALAAMMGSAEVGVDLAITDNWTLDVTGKYNPISTSEISLKHYGAEVGTKYWLYENFVGHFVGAHLGYTKYDIGDKTTRYNGDGYTLGLSYGYAWILSVRWSVAVEAGVGVAYTADTDSDPTAGDWDDQYFYHCRRLLLIPTRVGVTFNYLF